MFRSCDTMTLTEMGHEPVERHGRPVRLLIRFPDFPLDCQKSIDCVDFLHLASFFSPNRPNKIKAALFVSCPGRELIQSGRVVCTLES